MMKKCAVFLTHLINTAFHHKEANDSKNVQ